MDNPTILIIDNKRIVVNYEKIQKMASMYYALENGCSVKKIKDGKYECTKADGSKIQLGKFSKNHLKTIDILK